MQLVEYSLEPLKPLIPASFPGCLFPSESSASYEIRYLISLTPSAEIDGTRLLVSWVFRVTEVSRYRGSRRVFES